MLHSALLCGPAGCLLNRICHVPRGENNSSSKFGEVFVPMRCNTIIPAIPRMVWQRPAPLLGLGFAFRLRFLWIKVQGPLVPGHDHQSACVINKRRPVDQPSSSSTIIVIITGRRHTRSIMMTACLTRLLSILGHCQLPVVGIAFARKIENTYVEKEKHQSLGVQR